MRCEMRCAAAAAAATILESQPHKSRRSIKIPRSRDVSKFSSGLTLGKLNWNVVPDSVKFENIQAVEAGNCG